jgi:hypothetical protein
MLNPDDLDAERIAGLDDTDLEITRLHVLRHDDERWEIVVNQLALRAVPVISRVVREMAPDLGMTETMVRFAIQDASARVLTRIQRRSPIGPIRAEAASIAAQCAREQPPRPGPKITRRPTLRVIKGTLRKNDWRTS